MLWAALLLPRHDDTTPPPSNDAALRGLATWALQFTPRVAVVAEAVVLEVEASVRLFCGKRALRDRVVQESRELGVEAVAWAPTSRGAIALARAGKENGFRRPLAELLDELPMETLGAVGRHQVTLTQLGCRTLGDIRKLPRGGISRRFDKDLLAELDQAYGQRPEAHAWIQIPEGFKARLELMSRVDLAPALLFGARRLLIQMCGWLAARHAGATAFVLRWTHDSMRAKDIADSGELVVRTAAPMRDLEHLCRLLAENLAKVQLLAPAGDLELEALDVQAPEEHSESLIPDSVRSGESLTLVLERTLAVDAALLWASFENLHNKHGLPGELEIPMESFARAVEIVLKESELRDSTSYRPDAALWSVAARSCGYIQSRQAMSQELAQTAA